MKVLFITNIPNPYRNDFYNELGKYVELTVIYEAMRASNQGIRFNWDNGQVYNYRAIFLNEGDIDEKKLDKQIFRYISRNYNYIFVTNYAYRTEMAAIVFLKVHHIPYIMEIDGGIIRKENMIKRIIKRFLISKASAYFSPSAETDKFLLYYGADKNKINRHPFTSLHKNQILEKLPSKEEKTVIRRKLGIVGDNVILGVGQLIYRKGWDVLLNIAKDIDADVYILGDGELRKQYEQIIIDKHITNVHFMGFQSNEVTRLYYVAADVFVLPTREDIWGLVINEAMAYGLPIVTTDRCNAGLELIKNGVNGFVVPVNLSVETRNAIIKALSEKEEMGLAALDRIKDCTIENMALEHMKLMLKGDTT